MGHGQANPWRRRGVRLSYSRIIVALDFASAEQAMEFVSVLKPEMCRLKVGKELFTIAGPDLVRQLVDKGFDVFLDLKFHDIPNTVGQACKAAASLGVWMLNLHALGGRNMMLEARNGIDSVPHSPKLIAVTILTSMAIEDLEEVGLHGDPESNVLRLASLANDSGLDGVVCSSREVSKLRMTQGEDFCLVTPGIRPAGSDVGDQKRIMTPVKAVKAGSDYLVIGRPITQAADPVQTLQVINTELLNV